MRILLENIKSISNNGEFTSLELLSGDVVHTFDNKRVSMSMVEEDTGDGLKVFLGIDVIPSE